MRLVANARMYAVNPETVAAWTALFDHVATRSGVRLDVIAHAAPAPLEDLWRRDDLGLAFICGYPFATGMFPVQPVAGPIPLSSDGHPYYATHLVVRADGNIATLADSFGQRLGWTVAHSQSGFNALRSHFLPYRQVGKELYGESHGPLVTPRRVITALLGGEIDIGPLDSYFYDLLLASEPGTAASLRIIETTLPRPMPLLVASKLVPEATIGALREALFHCGDDAPAQVILSRLRLSGFARVQPEDYALLVREADIATRAGYITPG